MASSKIEQLNDESVKILMYIADNKQINDIKYLCKNWKLIHNQNDVYLYKERILETLFYKKYLSSNGYALNRLFSIFNGQWDRLFFFLKNLSETYLFEATLQSDNGYVIYHKTHVMHFMFNILNNKNGDNGVLLVNNTDSFYFTTKEIYTKACNEVINVIFKKIANKDVFVDEIFVYLNYFRHPRISNKAISELNLQTNTLDQQYKNSDVGSCIIQ